MLNSEQKLADCSINSFTFIFVRRKRVGSDDSQCLLLRILILYLASFQPRLKVKMP